MSPSLLIPAAAKAVLLADLPAAIPSTVAIRAAGDKAPVERPYLIFLFEDATSPHAALCSGTLVLRLRTRADEQDAATASAWHRAAVDYFRENPAALAATILPHGWQLTHFTTAANGFSDTPDDERGRELDQRFSVWVKDKS